MRHLIEAGLCLGMVIVGVAIAAVKANRSINRITGDDK
jgi:hypothetical protein